MIRIVVADHHPLIRQGVTAILGGAEGFSVVATATSHAEAMRACRRYQPDVLLLALNLPDGSPFEAVTRLRKRCPATRVVILSGSDDPASVSQLLERGIAGYILKNERPDTIRSALHSIVSGHAYFSPAISAQLLHSWTSPEQPQSSSLTERQREVLTLIARGYMDRQIANELGSKESTVRYHISNMFDRTSLISRVELALRGIQQRWIEIG